MTGNRRLFTSYKVYDGGYVIFRSNLKGKVGDRGHLCDDDCVVSFTKVDCTISKSDKSLARDHRRNGLYTCKLGDNFKQQICLASVVDNSTLWHRRLGHSNIWTRKEVSTTRVLELFHLDLIAPSPIQSYRGYSQTSKAYIVLNKETIRIKESFNVTFDESLPEPRSPPLVEDDRIDEPIVQDLNGSPSLQVNVSNEGYPKSLKEAIGHPIKQVIGELNERILRSKTKQA
ncbi:retrotransposon protein [Tanacetum coccineum]